MSYTVLARKYRSWTFDEIVGQAAIAQTLKNAITSGRVHHAYLFPGTRGVGKTAMARILARSLNCLRADGPTVTPCRECESCLAIAEGQDVDVIEIDAASNTGAEDMRVLCANASYRPARARYKIYVIDEVHMLSMHAFNALLKTLEEPPEHVKFILATTDPQKVPATIHSRCQRFDFRSISPEQIGGQINKILQAEGCTADEAVVRRVARLANGSMRDALSLLDQLMSMSPRKLTIELLEEVLPTPHDQLLAGLIDRWAEHDAAGALGLLEQCISQGYSLDRFCDAMIDQLRTLMLIHVCGPNTPLVDIPAQFRDEIVARAARFDAAAYVHRIAVLEELRRNVRFSQAGRALADAVIVRLSEAIPQASVSKLLAELERGAAPADAEKKKSPPAVASPAPPARPAAAPPGPRPRTGSARPAFERAAAPPAPAPIPARRASSEDIQAARSDPLVRKALELFDGSLVNVEHLNHGTAGPPAAQTP